MSIERIQKTLDKLYQGCGRFDCSSEFKALIISDLHLGKGDEADDFGDKDQIFCDIVGDFFVRGYNLIILGDYVDLWEVGDLKKIISAHPLVVQLVERFRVQKRVIQLAGNHDGKLLYPDAIRLLFPSGKEMFLTHGHRGSWACDRAGWIGKAFVRYIWAGIGQRVFGLKDPTSARFKVNPQKHEETRKAYNDWANEGKINLVYGHTHYHEDVGLAHNVGCYIGNYRDSYKIVNEKLSYFDSLIPIDILIQNESNVKRR